MSELKPYFRTKTIIYKLFFSYQINKQLLSKTMAAISLSLSLSLSLYIYIYIYITLSVVSLKYSSGTPRVSFFNATIILERLP